MCGRYALFSSIPDVLAALGLADESELGLAGYPARYNIAPTQAAPVLRRAERGLELALLRWGLIPSWAKDEAFGARCINARSESAADKPSFRSAYRHRRCLVPADGFYEWKREGRSKTAHWIRRRDGRPLMFAGLWERWPRPDRSVESFAVLTTRPNAALVSIHDRMPVILAGAEARRWLTAGEPPAGLLGPCPDDVLEAIPVGAEVGRVSVDHPGLIRPAEASEERQLGLFG